MQMLKDSPRLYPGAVELIRLLHGKAKLAVVSGTWRENIKALLGAAGLDDCFETIVRQGGCDVGQSRRPKHTCWHSKSFEYAAKSAVAIEDSPAGLASARAAGIASSPSAIAIPSATG